ncbi:response regulator [Persicimonas caeni]|uniref:histidine kinase n=1 Tax=Persicimonas caeni TaxID=2292766 RepID=A0A4Y6PTN8_PERCE|nr:ATP-binding protein [Persicimonas caeni]QDG51610.1 response regulator [Persicimonas caeni]QED32831.1 response regulator [Persicimonas caeni]
MTDHNLAYALPPIPPSESERLEALRALDILDTEAERNFDDLVELASFICDVPIALCSLVDEDRQWFKACVGLDVTETSRDVSFCGHAINQYEPFIVEDAHQDERFRHNPLVVGEPHIRFYAGFPLVLDDDLPLGTLCIIDTRPRTLTPRQLEAMQALQRQMQDQLRLRAELRRSERVCKELGEHVSDLTETSQKLSERGEAALRQLSIARRHNEVLVEESNDPILFFDEDGCILDANQRTLDALGYTLDQLRGARFIDVLRPDCTEDALGCFEQALRGAPSSVEVVVLTSDDRELYGVASARRIELGDSLVVQSIFRDHTEQRHARDELESTRRQLWQAQKFDSLGRLASGVAHDFNNMLSVITTCAEFLLQDLDQADPRRQDVTDIAEAAKQSAGLTRQLLAFSRSQRLDARVTCLDMLVGRPEKLFRRLVDASVDLEVELGAGALEVFVDPGQIEQVLVNLLINARDALEDDGNIRVETRRARVFADDPAARPPGVYGVITVRDDGIGMDAPTLDKVFEPFFTTKAEGEGTGLGLATAHGIVAQSGGFIEVDSTPGEGSEFRVWLPEATEEQCRMTPVERRLPEQPVDIDVTVLLVEEHPLVRRSTQRCLERMGVEVYVAKDGAQALELWQAHQDEIAALISDIRIPATDGVGILTQLRAEEPALPAILLTGHAETMWADEWKDASTLVLRKPTTPQRLLSVLSSMLVG